MRRISSSNSPRLEDRGLRFYYGIESDTDAAGAAGVGEFCNECGWVMPMCGVVEWCSRSERVPATPVSAARRTGLVS